MDGVDYQVIAGERVGREAEKIAQSYIATIGLGSPAVVAEETWEAIDAMVPVPEGHIEFSKLEDLTSGIEYREGDLPVEIPVGHKVRANVIMYNDTPYDQTFTYSIEFLDTHGGSHGLDKYTGIIAGGGTAYETTYNVTLEEGGTWKIHALLEA